MGDSRDKDQSQNRVAYLAAGRAMETFGNIQILHKNSVDDGTFSVTWINRMNNLSIAVHRFERWKHSVEFGSPKGVDYLLNFKHLDQAVQTALLNTDVTRIPEDTAIKARRAFLAILSRFDRTIARIAFSETAWKTNRFRNLTVTYDNELGEQLRGVLSLLLPPSGEQCMVIPVEGPDKGQRQVISTARLWIQ